MKLRMNSCQDPAQAVDISTSDARERRRPLWMAALLVAAMTGAGGPIVQAQEAAPEPGQEGRVPHSIVGAQVLNATVAGAGTTYLVDVDNEDNAGSGVADGDMGGVTPPVIWDTDPLHPIEFNIDVSGSLPTTSAELIIEAYDVDETAGQHDQVLFNGTPLGLLTGANLEWSNSVFSVPVGLVLAGNNLVTIVVDENPPGENGNWWIQVGSGQLLVDGGAAGTASCRSITSDQAHYDYGDTVTITTEVDTTLGSQNIRVESNILDNIGVNVGGSSSIATITGAANDAVQVAVPLPTGGGGGQHTLESLIFDNDSGIFQTRCTTPITVTSLCESFEDFTQPLPASNHQGSWFTSDRNFVYETIANTADHGVLAPLTGPSIRRLRYWGVSAEWDGTNILGECLDGLTIPFDFYFYADSAGAPGALLDSRLGIQTTATDSGDCCWNPGISNYQFDAEFVTPVDSTDVRWIGIRRQQGAQTPAGNTCVFGWVTESDTLRYDNEFFQRDVNVPAVNIQPGVLHDMTLCIDASSIFLDGFESGDVSGWDSQVP